MNRGIFVGLANQCQPTLSRTVDDILSLRYFGSRTWPLARLLGSRVTLSSTTWPFDSQYGSLYRRWVWVNSVGLSLYRMVADMTCQIWLSIDYSYSHWKLNSPFVSAGNRGYTVFQHRKYSGRRDALFELLYVTTGPRASSMRRK